jgi:hypothetical protein
MSFSYAPNVDELLADQLVQAVMRADRVEPVELRTLLSGVAGRIARRREGERKAVRFFATPRLEWRSNSGGANALAGALPAPAGDACVAGLCC